MPEALLGRYFDQVNGRYVFNKDMRRRSSSVATTSSRTPDLPRGPARLPQHLDVLQRRDATKVLSRLHFALAPEGVLFLGHAEMLLSHSGQVRANQPQAPHLSPRTGSHSEVNKSVAADSRADRHGDLSGLGPLRELAFGASPVAQIVVTV